MKIRESDVPSVAGQIRHRVGDTPHVPDHRTRLGPVQTVPVSLLLPGDSPRMAGTDPEHARLLTQSEVALPPIIVHRDTMRVIDGVHRLCASMRRGDRTIEVRFFDGAASDAFVLAVQVNIKHGLPLSSADRSAAAERILHSHPRWSDRAIAMTTGLSAKTVAVIRARTSTEESRSGTRVGLDGRVRPVNSADGRRVAGEFAAANPGASLRAIARVAGVSVGTARDVRERLHRGEDPVLPRQRTSRDEYEDSGVLSAKGKRRTPANARNSVLQILRNDPSMRYALSGRLLLRLLDLHTGADDWKKLARVVPPHCVDMLSDAAHECAQDWWQFAEQLERRQTGSDHTQ